MKKGWIGILGVLAFSAAPLCADGFSQEDEEKLIAGKGVFPGPGGGSSAAMPGDTPEDDGDDDTDSSNNGNNQDNGNNSQNQQKKTPNSNTPEAEKGVFPKSKDNTPQPNY